MHFAHAIAIVIARPFPHARRMAHRLMHPPARRHPTVPLPFITIEGGGRCTGGFSQRAQLGGAAMLQYSQADLPAGAAHHSAHWGSVIVPGAMPPPFIGPPPGW